MIPLLFAATAFAQGTVPAGAANYGTDGDWRDCQNHSSIAGTAGFENARTANETNALAYGATTYLQETIWPQLREAAKEADGDWHGAGGYRFRTTAGAASVPTLELGYPYAGCPDELRISNRPLDLGAINFGVAATNGTVGLFYTSSITYGYTPSNDPRERFLLGMTGFTYGTMGALLAPLAGSDQAFGEGASAVYTDFVLGGLFDVTGVHGRLGYVGSRGLFADIEADIPVFASAVIDEPSLSNLLSGGLRRLNTGTPAGKTSLFVRNKPFRPLPKLSSGGTGLVDDATGGLDFTTGHLGQADIGDHVDIQVAYALRPTPQIHEAQVAVHSDGFTDGRDNGASFLLRGGVVQLPDLWFYGVQGGLRPTFRAEAGIAFAEDGSASAGSVRYLVMMNDPEQLLLFPYAVNAVTMGITAGGSF